MGGMRMRRMRGGSILLGEFSFLRCSWFDMVVLTDAGASNLLALIIDN